MTTWYFSETCGLITPPVKLFFGYKYWVPVKTKTIKMLYRKDLPDQLNSHRSTLRKYEELL